MANHPRPVAVGQLEQFADGSAKGFDPFGQGRDLFFVVRNGETLRAYLNRCPHHGASLPWRSDEYLNASGTHIVCSAHGAQFDIGNGRCVRGAAMGGKLEPVTITKTDSGEWHVLVAPPFSGTGA